MVEPVAECFGHSHRHLLNFQTAPRLHFESFILRESDLHFSYHRITSDDGSGGYLMAISSTGTRSDWPLKKPRPHLTPFREMIYDRTRCFFLSLSLSLSCSLSVLFPLVISICSPRHATPSDPSADSFLFLYGTLPSFFFLVQDKKWCFPVRSSWWDRHLCFFCLI